MSLHMKCIGSESDARFIDLVQFVEDLARSDLL